ncbi:MAG: FtsK/SpoIIIE domain-containing protein, partial [Cutibacterium avidum]|nr:FtsK/SpoIIIE domain-containing protein [Cutibacterium avidum]MDU5547746.1 FtsK/SpoIIIE domain-containing protein [Cutibacterium avidum]
GLHSLEEKPTRDPYVITFIAHETEPRDMLAEQKTGGEFFTEHPATTPNKIPLAVKENGQPWSLSTHHTLIYGMTGSGKGSVIHGVITQLAPYVEEGRCQLWGIDPKASELRPYQESRLFTAIVYETEDAQRLIEELYRTMKTRSKNKKVDLKHAELGRSLNATKATPMIVLIVDEMLSLLSSIKSKGKAGTKTLGLLTEILAQGRSLGIYVIGATQAVDTELLGRMRQNFANAIILKQESEYYNDLFLGEGAKEKGFNSTEIPASNKANDYAYAGIGYVKEETGDPVRVRFAYSSDRDIADLCQRFIPDDEWDSRQEVLADYEGLPDITEFE